MSCGTLRGYNAKRIGVSATSKPNKLYINPAKNGAGAYVNLIGDNEVVLGEIDITSRSKLAVSAFYVKDKTDYDTFKLQN